MPAARDLVVLYGGPSAEHEVSCVSARRIAATARRDGNPVSAIGLTHRLSWVRPMADTGFPSRRAVAAMRLADTHDTSCSADGPPYSTTKSLAAGIARGYTI